MPSAPAVEPPGERLSIARRISALSVDLCRLQHRAGVAGIGDDRHGIVGLQLIDQKAEGALEKRQPVGLVHRTGDVDQEHEIGAASRPARRHSP